MSLELKNVEKKVGIDTHIHPTSLKLEKNTINVLLGSTLAGKTTLMQIMAGLDKPTSGEIWFDGKNVTGMKVQKRNCSMVCLLYTSPSPRDVEESRMPSSA